MSGIYIPGMEMPKDGSFEVLVVHDNGIVTKGFFPNENEHTKAIFIPDHGRLIDADALEDYCHRQTKNKWNESTQTSWAYAYASFESDVEDAPTIIEYVPVIVNGKQAKQTNADRIRSMTDEELADELLEWYAVFSAVEWTKDMILDWLRKEAADKDGAE